MAKVLVIKRKKAALGTIEAAHPCLSSLVTLLLAAEHEANELVRSEGVSEKDADVIYRAIQKAKARVVRSMRKIEPAW